ncbi:unnamed protein product, partial [Ixodes pacificus]
FSRGCSSALQAAAGPKKVGLFLSRRPGSSSGTRWLAIRGHQPGLDIRRRHRNHCCAHALHRGCGACEPACLPGASGTRGDL